MLTLAQVLNKSAARLSGLHPAVLAAATVLIERSYVSGIPILITQGLRTMAEQDALYAQGRTKPGAVVTNARGGYSYHNYGLAVDFALLLPNGSSVSWDMSRDGNQNGTRDWMEVVQHAKAIGFEWGGDWTSFKDYPHLQMRFGLSLAELRTGKKPAAAAVEAVVERMKPKEEQAVKTQMKVAVQVNGKKIADGWLDGGVTYVPARKIAEALGAQIAYHPAVNTVEITTIPQKGGIS
ncbi:M15 family metallopeptidase [Paenibacillus sp. FSL H7-0756]|uniref:M15 family metallopeptidase n=1 Tax=Paenibacillus sp. FSL H7-0756 TaxID=2954738 RepID=UPI0030FA6A50